MPKPKTVSLPLLDGSTLAVRPADLGSMWVVDGRVCFGLWQDGERAVVETALTLEEAWPLWDRKME